MEERPLLKESAQSALSLSVLVDMQYEEFKKFIAKLRIYNQIVKHLNDFRMNPDLDRKSDLLSIDLIIFLYRLTRTNYRKLLTDIGEYIYYVFEKKRKETNVNKKEGN